MYRSIAILSTGLMAAYSALAQDASVPANAATAEPNGAIDLWHRVARGFGVEVQTGMFLGHRPVPTLFTNVPETLRTVPAHPDDGYPPGTTWTIPTASFALDNPKISGPTFVSVAPQFTLWRFTARAGVRIVPGTSLKVDKPIAGSPIPEINQQGTSQRGYGESLAYYFLCWDAKVAGGTNGFGELEFRVNRFLSVVGGYGRIASSSSVLFENGWDRYNALETHATQKLVSVTQSTAPFYAAVRIAFVGPYVGIRVGYAQQTSRLADLYPNVNPNFVPATRSGINSIFCGIDLRLTQSKAQ